MKNTVLVIIALALCASCVFGCQAPASQEAGLPNPMVESNPEEILQKLGVEFLVPEGAEDVRYFIISGKMDEEITVVTDTVAHTTDTIVTPVIKDLRWGIETMKYYKEGPTLEQLLRFGYLPNHGDALVIRNTTDAHNGEFNY